MATDELRKEYAPGREYRVEPRGKHTATVIFLHGLGDTGAGWSYEFENSVSVLFPHVRFIFPTAPTLSVSLNFGMRMPAWYDIKTLDKSGPMDEDRILLGRELVESYISKEAESGIPSSRVVVAGFSQGGAIALVAGLMHSQTLAGIAGLSTYFAMGEKVAAQLTDENKKTPVIMFHGKADPVVQFHFGKSSSEAIERAGVPMTFKAYEGLPHSSCPEEMQDLVKWLNERIPPTSNH
eukprot:CAMPEP_0119119986 /NCGR_PEP_ID=MMETSP1310-20130426/1238_1 /TAXON_ID=464262 /ORGANISM="Genus nov. species nov., Strain RCC2339" /LENGTH=236 /DNA_ID=CAMNT_0007109449 /DNA_START=137 /DNA_END=847 /DNA_ORIENTATION=-